MSKYSFFVSALVLLSLYGCHRQSKYAYLQDKPLPVEIEVVSQTTQMVTNTYVGEIQANSEVSLVFPLGGQLTSLLVKSGEKVAEGQVIATVDDTQAKSMLESAEAILRQAEDAYERLKPVHEQGGLSDVKWVEMETNLQKARSMAVSSRKRYEDCTLRAPFEGIVNLKNAEVGQHVAIGQPVASILDMTSKKARFTVPESEIGVLMRGDKLNVYLPALDKTFNAVLDEKSFIATHLAHTYKVIADIDNIPETEVLLPGMICRVLITKKELTGFVISSGCVQTQKNGHSVWVLRNGRAERVMIKIADFVENGVLVEEGLQAGDTIVSKGYQKMYNGALVNFD